MPTLNENSVDCILTDPPYGLSFMGKAWDHGVPGVAFWEAARRVMKPGAFLLAFGGTRTHHRLTCAIEDAGFEIRDCMMWLYGSGFPKSHDVSKAIDKAAGAEREVIGTRKSEGGRTTQPNTEGIDPDALIQITVPSTDAARQWSGWGTALKPAWEPIIVARKPLEGTVAENVSKWGCGAMNIDASRIGFESDTDKANFRNDSEGINRQKTTKAIFSNAAIIGNHNLDDSRMTGRWPANVILDEEAGAMLDGQSGDRKAATSNSRGHTGTFDFGTAEKQQGYGDIGGASRFFYCAKASKKERGEDNNHPTVKPISLLNYLAKLACPPRGLILDPFMGSGSTGLAAQNIGDGFIGIEREKSYCEIANSRLNTLAAA